MGRLAGFSGRETARVAALHGWQFKRQAGSHRIYGLEGSRWTLAIPDHRSIDEGLLRDLPRKMDLSIDDFLKVARK